MSDMDTIERAAARLGQAPTPTSSPPASPAAGAPLGQAAHGRARPRRSARSVAVDADKLEARGMVVLDESRSRIKEEYRQIKRPLLANVDGKGATVSPYPNLIMVTSARPAEGKTFTAINLALSIAAEQDRTVLLIDADVVRPSISRFFDISPGPGLVDFLVKGGIDLADTLVETSVPTLTLLPSGGSHHLANELLASEAMRRLMHEISHRYRDRVIIIDSPPLLATTEARVLATLVGQVVMVVEADRTRRSQVEEAVGMLDRNQAIGLVLNKSRGSSAGGYGPYYGYYGDE